ncbi:hypothetical protein D5041_09385 [Verminephrobacter aporrectodeae subsp. tuberculatae]|uniref:STAS domain-containing protein n=1 Tax=Verminephrobacter aporrectodeae TaxID=1110389 RepID=UPI0022386C67|nr:STAS domain-containing protein [Verminephrobacter aporrectodeae]MCW5219979.1 hypothetical protein [Verminephrobacter aporrectodeae subsp. tuberculatae]MCW5289267.1 hypothetical protein [Verminephrobacter aporrectodeae subsp. tuberculatae]
MSKEDSTPGGLLSKVVRFVRNPTTDWRSLNTLQDDKESLYSKQMLKEMIERKRRNDFVRQREFDQLRRLRQRGVQPGRRVAADPAAQPSFFHSSMVMPDERADTLKKIDEIEAQMAQQWWKSKPGAGDAPARPPVAADVQATDAQAYAPTVPASLQALLEPPPPPAVAPLFANDSSAIGWFAGTTVPAAGYPAQAPLGPAPAPRRPVPIPAPAPAPVLAPREFVHEPDLEEAAILFANGDHAGAESGLLEVLAQRQQDAPEQQIEVWMTLFDLYRAIGRNDRFESLAIDFAARFNRSAPLWFSMPEQLGMAGAAAPAEGAVAASAVHRDFNWHAPAMLAVTSVAALQASLARADGPWPLFWERLTDIDPAAVPLLTNLFVQWANQEGQFVFSGVERLNALLGAKTPSGERSHSPDWWLLRMAVLRLMDKLDEFELVALDYCVTYEVSPPAWVAPRCGYRCDEGASSDEAPLAPDNGNSGHSDFMASDLGELSAPPDTVPAAQLSGHIDGSATPLLAPFDGLLRPGVPFSIACDMLIRVDFAAAGSVLNWAAEQQGRGHVVAFHNLQRLVAIFFNVIGINEHAWVLPRKN